MSREEVAVILAEAIARPTLGARSLLRHLRVRGVDRSASGVAKVLVSAARYRETAGRRAGLDHRGRDRSAHRSGAGRPVRVLPLRLRPWSGGRSGHLLRRTAQGNRGGLAVHRGRRRHPDRGGPALVGDKAAVVAARFLDHLNKALRKHGIRLSGVLTDNGPEFIGKIFPATLRSSGCSTTGSRPGHPTTTRSANTSTAPCSRVLPTPLPPRPSRRHRPAGPVPAGLAIDYNEHRPNHGDYMGGRTPQQVKKELRRRSRHTAA